RPYTPVFQSFKQQTISRENGNHSSSSEHVFQAQSSLHFYRVEVLSCSDNICQPVNCSFRLRTASTSCCPLSSGMVAMAFSLNSPRGSNSMDSEQGANLPT